MSGPWQLSPHDREFFTLVSRATLVNPFSEERGDLDRAIAGTLGTTRDGDALREALQRVTERVRRLETENKAHVSSYRDEDHELMKAVFLFEIYHRFTEHFDKLISSQVERGDNPCPAAFAPEALAILSRRGFTKEEALRYFAICYQVRRAFYFIYYGLGGRSRSMQQLRLRLWNNVFTRDTRLYGLHLWNRLEDFSTLLLGETGTGKGTAAAAIGRSGFIPFDERRGCFTDNFTRSFVTLNLSQYPEALIESELFGHRKGAFTGAVDHHEGVFSQCSPHGAIFLDEIGDVSVPVQIKLLQVLQERTFSAVGGHGKVQFRGRVIAATNKPLDDLRRSGRFREDFYYRLCSDIVVVPPLRQRLREDPGEFEDLLAHVLRSMIGDPPPGLLDRICCAIERDVGRDYPWPGNVRELEQAVRRVIITRGYPGDDHRAESDLLTRILTGVEAGDISAQDLLASYCRLLYERHGTLGEVARRTGLDRRTARKYAEIARRRDDGAPTSDEPLREAARLPIGNNFRSGARRGD